jgi:NTE family protein
VSHLLAGVLADPLANDIRTLAGINDLLARTPRPPPPPPDLVPYVFVAPQRRDTIGTIARRVYRAHYDGVSGLRRSPSVALLGRLLDGGENPSHGELLSYLLFAPEFAEALLEQGREDARRWLGERHWEGPWQLGPLEGEQ